MDLRKEFDSLVKQYGIEIYLRRVQNPFAPDESPAYNYTLEKHLVRSMNPATSGGVSQLLSEEPEGINIDVDMIFWFRWDSNPMSGDLIYEFVPRYPHEIAYQIDYADPKYGAGGRIEFWTVGTTRVRPE